MPRFGKQPPSPHETLHQDGGAQEISVADLSGELADDQPPKVHALAGAKHTSAALAALNLLISDATLDDEGDTRIPAAHGSLHENDGTQEISVAALSGELADDQPPKVHGAAEHTDVTRTLFLPCGVKYSGTPAYLLYGGVIEVVDGSTKYVNWYFRLPDDFVSVDKLETVWECGAASGNLYWDFSAQWGSVGESYAAHSSGADPLATATGGSGVINASEPVGVWWDISSMAAGDFVGAEFVRKGSYSQDTLEDDVNIIGLLITYTASQ